MAWLFGTAVFLTVIYLLVRFESVRAIAGIAVVAGGLWAAWAWQDTKDKERESRSAIKSWDLDLENVELINEYGSWKVRGFLRNRSQRDLESLTLNIKFEKCKQPTACDVVGEDERTIFENVPAGQARDFEVYATTPPGDWTWSYTVGEIVARRK